MDIKLLFESYEAKNPEVVQKLGKVYYDLGFSSGFSLADPLINTLESVLSLLEAKEICAFDGVKANYEDIYHAHLLEYKGSAEVDAVLHCNEAIEVVADLSNNAIKMNESLYLALDWELRTEKNNYIPIEKRGEMLQWMERLKYLFNENISLDPLIRLAFLYYHFEFDCPSEGFKRRMAKLVSSLFLYKSGLFFYPVLPISSFFLKTKREYESIVQRMHDENEGAIDDWIIYILEGMEISISRMKQILIRTRGCKFGVSQEIKLQLPKIYSEELMNALFSEYYHSADSLAKAMNLTEVETASFLKKLENAGFLISIQYGERRIYKNRRLFETVEGIFLRG